MTRRRALWVGLGLTAAASTGVVALAIWTGPERDAVRAYTRLIGAANRGDTESASSLCSARYRASHPIRAAAEGGIVGFPRNIHPNFRVWRQGRDVWLCPTNRVGPVYRFIPESGGWRFDGPVGVLLPGGRVARFGEGRGQDPPADLPPVLP